MDAEKSIIYTVRFAIRRRLLTRASFSEPRYVRNRENVWISTLIWKRMGAVRLPSENVNKK